MAYDSNLQAPAEPNGQFGINNSKRDNKRHAHKRIKYSPKIDNCQINGGIAVDGSPIISNNKFSGGVDSYFGAIGVDSGDPVIFANQFDGDGYLTAIIVSSSDPFDISENLFSNCSSGVKVQAADGAFDK